MSETVQAIEMSLGPLTERSRAENGDKDLDRSLVESTKQQSMQEMVGLEAFIFTPFPTYRQVITALQQTNFENIMTKEEIAHDEQFTFCHNVVNFNKMLFYHL